MAMQWSSFFVRAGTKVFLILLVFCASAQALELPVPTTELEMLQTSQGKILVGDRLDFKVNQAGHSFELADSGESLEEKGFSIEVKNNTPGALFLTVVPIQSGKLSIPSLVIKDAEGAPLAHSLPFAVEVFSVVDPKDPKAKELAEMRPPLSMAFPLLFVVLLISLGLVLFGLMLWGIFYWIKKMRLPKTLVAHHELLEKPADEMALRALLDLENQNLIAKEKFKIYYFRISEILKQYIGNRYHFDASESTTQEIVEYFREKKNVISENRGAIQNLFEDLDRVKFTDYKPGVHEAQGVLENSRAFILSTRQIKTPPPLLSARGVS